MKSEWGGMACVRDEPLQEGAEQKRFCIDANF